MINGVLKNILRVFFPLGVKIKIDAEHQVIRVYNGDEEVKKLTFDEAEKEINEQFPVTDSNS